MGKKMTITEIPPKSRKELSGGLLGKERVCAYCRVSTDSEEQESSYENQIRFYKNMISKNPAWKFVGIYAEQGISGKNVINRPQFLKMIQDCRDGKINRIITKSISRFARNTKDSIEYIMLLRGIEVGVFFEKEGIYSLDPTSNLVFNILSTVAEEESRSISNNVKTSLNHLAQEGGIHIIPCYGYKLNKNGKMIIDRKTAPVIKTIYKLFLSGKTITDIRLYLIENNVPTPNLKAKTWYYSAVKYILTNEKAMGNVLLKKTHSRDFLDKRVLNNGISKQWVYENHHEPIISKEDFEKVKKLIKLPFPKAKTRRSSAFPLSGLIECAHCKRKYYKAYLINNHKVRIESWRCYSKKLKSGIKCPSPSVREDDIFKIFNKICPQGEPINIRKLVEKVEITLSSQAIFHLKDGKKSKHKLPIHSGKK